MRSALLFVVIALAANGCLGGDVDEAPRGTPTSPNTATAPFTTVTAMINGSTEQPSEPATIAARGRSVWFALGGSIVASDDEGATWSVVGGLDHDVRALTFVSTELGWAATEGGLSQTSDGGSTWSAVDTLPAEPLDDVEFIDGLHGWVLRGKEVLRTVDGGGEWLLVASPCAMPGPFGPSIAFADERAGWAMCPMQSAVGGQARDLFVTSDGGESWQLFSWNTAFGNRQDEGPSRYALGSHGYVNDLAFLDPQNGWMSGGRMWPEVTSDGGRSWQYTELPEATEPGSYAVSFASIQRGYVIAQRQVWATADGGTTWEQVWGTPPQPVESTALRLPSLPGYVVYSQWSTSDGTKWLVAGSADFAVRPRLMSSLDGGAHWTIFETPGITPDKISSPDGERLIMRDHWAAYESDDAGMTWTRVEPDLTTGR